ncbi:MAG: shikimate kinase [Candidatus Limivicinus sp.]|nr:shikimate kinase [Candidatus Limivicinus sp.]
MNDKKRCGLIGEKLGHSFSPAIHGKLADYEYKLYELSPEQVGPFLEKKEYDGLNVTIPYKKTVIPYCDELTEAAKSIGSVNTIVKRPDGTLLGHNTDYDGFMWLLKNAGAEVKGKKALVLGTGGASVTVQAALRDLGAASVVVISRSGEDNYENIARHSDAKILVNATPVGMYPKTGVSPVDLDSFTALEGVFDVVYNPAKTQLLLDAEKRGIPCANGLGMLVAQAKAACERFTGEPIDDEKVYTIKAEMERNTRNVMLIGMPGSGKSTVGAALAEKLGRKLVDVDERIVEMAGCSIPEIFAKEGEEGFRKIEHQALCEVSKESGLVIATGGGVVTRRENLDPMRQNSLIVWLLRDISLLPKDGRPLSQANSLTEMFKVREPMYRAAADCIADNNGSLEDTVKQILEAM